ncbi:MAG: bifunctional adenosylcobinamide kinase/adenosylcobinamide-phosphate guanylyltransferase [Clostridia bacterium]|nr:bifunctional adenosylcobinamide kinase/adenosylcobinamide-phosphate guanylyltransferase [Clostridia bacterium]
MNVLISGGCKNGKTGFAQDIAVMLSRGGNRYYVATMIPFDGEYHDRIARHIDDRAGLGFATLEVPRDIASCLTLAKPDATFLVDSVTALLLNELFPESHNGKADPGAVDRCRTGLLKLAEGAKNAVFVTDYIYSDAMRYDAFTENYRAALASLDRALAEVCDTVIELCAGNVIFHKGGLPE